MTGAALKARWLEALDSVSLAVEAEARAHVLPPAESGNHRRLLAAERAWLATVDWSAFEPMKPAAVLELVPRTASSVAKRAA